MTRWRSLTLLVPTAVMVAGTLELLRNLIPILKADLDAEAAVFALAGLWRLQVWMDLGGALAGLVTAAALLLTGEGEERSSRTVAGAWALIMAGGCAGFALWGHWMANSWLLLADDPLTTLAPGPVIPAFTFLAGAITLATVAVVARRCWQHPDRLATEFAVGLAVVGGAFMFRSAGSFQMDRLQARTWGGQFGALEARENDLPETENTGEPPLRGVVLQWAQDRYWDMRTGFPVDTPPPGAVVGSKDPAHGTLARVALPALGEHPGTAFQRFRVLRPATSPAEEQ